VCEVEEEVQFQEYGMCEESSLTDKWMWYIPMEMCLTIVYKLKAASKQRAEYRKQTADSKTA
jgi:hypothetical protein